MASNFFRTSSISALQHASVVSLSAYRSGERLTDTRLGKTYDHTERADVVHKDILLPDAFKNSAAWAQNRESLWNRAQSTDPGKRARYGQEWLLALPHELTVEARQALVRDFAQHLVGTYGCAVDLAIHEPRPEGDERNHHAHLLSTARKVEANGFGERTDYHLSWKQLQANKKLSVPKQWQALRLHWIDSTNAALNAAGRVERIRHSQVDEFGLRIPVKPGWSRPVEALIRAGRQSDVANAELNRYDFELRRRELEIRALESDARLNRLRATLAADRSMSADTLLPTASSKPRDIAEAPFPTDFAGWLLWRAKQTFDPLEDERRAEAVIRRLQAPRTPSPTSGLLSHGEAKTAEQAEERPLEAQGPSNGPEWTVD